MSVALTILAAVVVAFLLIAGLVRLSLWMTGKKIAANPEAWRDSGHGQPGGYVSDAWTGGDIGGGDGD